MTMVLWRRKAIRFYLHSGFRHLKHLINDKAKKNINLAILNHTN